MKVLLLSIMLCFCAIGMAQGVTVKAVDEPAAVVFRSIVEQTGMNFVYSSALLKDMRVSVNVVDKTLNETLAILFKDTDIEWKVKGRNIILKQRVKKDITKRASTTRQRSLEPRPHQGMSATLEEVVVLSRLEAPVVETSEIGAKKLTAQDIISTPVLFGESDVIKSLLTQPGISEGQEGMAGMNVHGGNNDENLYMLDNVPLYQVNHFAGLFSAFNAEAIRYIDFFKSSIPAKYDGRLSSYLDVRTKNGSQEGHHGSFRLGLTSGAFNLDGPIGRRTTYSVAVRRSWFDVLTVPMLALVNSGDEQEKIRFNYSFMDLNAKVTHRFSAKATGFTSVYFGNDMLKTGSTDQSLGTSYSWYDDSKADFHWGNLVAQAGLNYRVNPDVTAEFTAAYTRYFSSMRYRERDKEVFPESTIETSSINRTNNNINDWILRADFNWTPGADHKVRFGGNYILHSFLPARTGRKYVLGQTEILSRDSTWTYLANEANVYIEDDWHINEKFRMNAGLHLSLFNISGKTNMGLGPRISVNYRLGESWAIKAAYARTNQYVHQLSQTYMSLPCDQWVPITGRFKPQSADKISLGAYWQSADNTFAASVEGYYKIMRNLVDYRDEYYLHPPTEMWNAQLCSGSGTARGIDFKIEKIFGKVTGHVSYSLAWSDRTFPDKNDGLTFPARFDNRHTIKILLNWDISDKVRFNAMWTGHSGNRFTLLPQVWESPSFGTMFPGDDTPLKTRINNYQLPFYHRLDLSFMVKNRHGYWTFGLFNAYCHMNTVAIRRAYHPYNKPVFQRVKLLPLIPSISYTWQF